MVTLSKCQPGYYYNTTLRQCECIDRKLHGNPVLNCDSTQFLAHINPIYWIGFDNSNNSNNSNVTLVGPCPNGYCYRKFYQDSVLFSKDNINGTYLSQQRVQLPNNASMTILDHAVCRAANRKGVLCGSCIKGYSVVMSSPLFSYAKCSNNEQYNALIFIPSYLIPVTLLFFLFMSCRIRITSVSLSAFLFFCTNCWQ